MKKHLLLAIAAIFGAAMMTPDVSADNVPRHRVQNVIAQDADGEDPDAPAGDNKDFDFSKIENWTGSGSARAALVLQWNVDGETTARVYGYRWDPTTQSATGEQMLFAVVNNNPELYMLTHYTDLGYTLAGMGLDRNEDGYIAITNGTVMREEGPIFYTFAYDYDSWTAVDDEDFWQSGWVTNGYWSYWVKNSTADDFTYSQRGMTTQTLSDGCWNGWMFKPMTGATPAWKTFATAHQASPDLVFKQNGVTYKLVSGHYGTVAVAGIDEGITSVNIPKEVTYTTDGGSTVTFTVTQVTAGACAGHASLSSVILPLTVTAVGDGAFRGCTQLQSLRGQGVKRIGKQAFEGCVALNSAYLQAAEIHGDYAFRDCAALTSYTNLRYRDSKYGKGVFAGTGLVNVTLADDIVDIPEEMFAGCASLTSVTFKAAIETIGASAFKGTSLTSLTLPASLKVIGPLAFDGVSTLEQISVASMSPAALRDNSFSDYSAQLTVPFTAGAVYGAHEYWSKFANIEEASGMFAEGVEFFSNGLMYRILMMPTTSANGRIEVMPYVNASGRSMYTGDVVVPDNLSIRANDNTPASVFDVWAIGESAFCGSTAQSIDMSACTKLSKIGSYAFSKLGNSNLKTIDIPTATGNNIATHSNGSVGMFAGSSNLEYIYGPSFSSIPDSTCTGCSKLIYCGLMSSTSTKIVGKDAFNGCTTLSQLPAPTINNLGERAFYNCTKQSLILDSYNLFKIGDQALYGVTVTPYYNGADADGVVTINNHWGRQYGAGAFDGVKGVRKFKVECFDYPYDKDKGWVPAPLPERFFKASTGSFAEEIELCDGVPEVGEECFRNQQKITAVNLPAAAKIGKNAFNYCRALNTFVFCDELTEIPEGAFQYCTSLSGIVLPPALCTIGDNAFGMCRITRLDMPTTVSSIGAGAFADTYLTEIDLSGCTGLTAINLRTFEWTPLKTVKMPHSLKTIAMNAFSSCSSLTEITGIENVTEIGESAFYNCSSLAQFTIPAGVRRIEAHTFQNCRKLAEINLPENIEFIGEYALRSTILKDFVIPPTKSVNLDWEILAGVPTTCRVWVCNPKSATYTGQSLNKLVSDVLRSTPFAGYYCLHGTADEINSPWAWYDENIRFKGVAVGVVPADEHDVRPGAIDCNIAAEVSFCHMTDDLGIAENVIPEVFRRANMAYYAAGGHNVKVEYREKGSEESLFADAMFADAVDEAATYGALRAASQKAMRVEAALSDLKESTTYEYRLYDVDGTAPEEWKEFKTGALSGMQDVVAEGDENTDAVYYNLQGIRVDNPGPGIYIKVCGTHSRRVYIK